ncbi:hypothetical protein HPP92_020694 [Vanilla planifolia]|uniref:RING-type domain-containing protein n=1 Tax=Vanilla planifolia TaxID=51239 RepID=A0A835UI35_VANPL|nr:hypothetical protein HPP92_020694 [Vanilla planifolia]
MDFVTTSRNRLLLSSAPDDHLVGGEAVDRENPVASELVERIVVGVITCFFVLVGASIGAFTGASLGLATETGLLRGAGIGAISGAVFSIESVESSVALWHSNESGFWSMLLVVMDIICSFLSGRLVREKVGPAVQSAILSQISALDMPYAEDLDIFETGGTRGMSKDSVELLSKFKITSENCRDCSGERFCCSVCLQDVQVGETVRCLPYCGHIFHLPCIDGWLSIHGSCPLCRRDI